MKRITQAIALLLSLLLLCACTADAPETTGAEQTTQAAETTQAVETTEVEETTEALKKPLVVIDAGHQAKGNSEKEPVGPGATEMKAKVSSGTVGTVTGIWEYQLNLEVAKMLQQILQSRGYEVVMVRTTHDVDISNSQRAQVANDLQADVFIRIHANSSEDSSVHGILTICQTESNPYNAQLYEKSKLLSQLVLDGMVDATGAKKRNVWETDTMSGINWCQVPVTIVEMGFMSNEDEDMLLATDEYRMLLAEGMAKGIDDYFAAVSHESG